VVVLQHLRRVRWAVRATLFLGVAASVVANVLHALDNPISQAIAAWPPLALLLTVELISRVPVHRRWLAEQYFELPAQRIALEEYIASQEECDKRVERLTQQIHSLLEGWKWRPVVEALQARASTSSRWDW